jgi:hypothetical protein
LVLLTQKIGEIGGSGRDFDGDLGVRTKRSDNLMNGGRVVQNGDIRKDISLLVHHADLNGFLVVVKTDKNW